MPYDADFFTGPYGVSGDGDGSLPAARQTPEALGWRDATLRYASLEADTLSWTQVGGDFLEYGEQIYVHTAAGKRVFSGIVTGRNETFSNGKMSVQMTASGPWWYLEKIQINGAFTDSAGTTTTDTPFYQVPLQDAAVTVGALIEIARGFSIPIQLGTVSTMFALPQIIFDSRSIARALVDVLSCFPDVATRVRYDVEGDPALDIVRRGEAEQVTLQIGIPEHGVASVTLNAQEDFRATSVTVQSYAVNVDGTLSVNKSTATTGETVTGPDWRRQYVAMTGPGEQAWREPTIDKVTLAAGRPTSGTSNVRALHYALDSQMADLLTQRTGTMDFTVMTGSDTITIYNGAGGWTVTTISARSTVEITPATAGSAGVSTSAIAAYALVIDAVPDWWDETGLLLQKVRLTTRLVANSSSSSVQAQLQGLATFTYSTGTGAGIVYYRDSVIEFYACADARFAAAATVLRPRDALALQMPPDLASNLLAAQAWTPFKGSIPLTSRAQRVPRVGDVVNVIDGSPLWRGMRIPVTATETRLETGATTLSFGAPGRLQAASLVERFRRSVQGDLVKLR